MTDSMSRIARVILIKNPYYHIDLISKLQFIVLYGSNSSSIVDKYDDGKLCVLALFKGKTALLSCAALSDLTEVSMQAVAKSQKIIKNPSTTEFKNSQTHNWKIVI